MSGGRPRVLLTRCREGWRASVLCRHGVTHCARWAGMGAVTAAAVIADARRAHEQVERCGCAAAAPLVIDTPGRARPCQT